MKILVPQRGSILIVDDFPPITKSLVRLVGRFAPGATTVVIHDYQEALPVVRAHGTNWVGFLFDIRLDARSQEALGVDLLEAARRHYPAVPAMIMTSFDDDVAVRRVATLNASYVPKPVGPKELKSLLVRSAVFETATDGPLADTLHELATRHELSVMQTKVLAANLAHLSPAQIRATYDITVNTYEDHLAGIRHRLGVASIHEACQLVVSDIVKQSLRKLG